jgi:hypothetical protein
MSLSVADYKWPVYPITDIRPNHLEGNKNDLIFDSIRSAIDLNQNIDLTTEVTRRWNRV